MIIGTIAGQRRTGAASTGLPNPIPGSLINMDFINDLYWVGNVQTPLADMLNEAYSVGADGLSCASGYKTFKGSALAAANVSWFTAIVEISYVLATTGNFIPFFMYIGTGSSYGFDIYGNRGSVAAEEYGPAQYHDVIWDGPYADTGYDMPTPSRVAVTRTDGRLAIAANGNGAANFNTGTSVSFTPDTIGIGDATGGKVAGLRIRKFVLMNPQAEGDLQSLSSL
jgi:hypothetical protein